MFSVVALVVPSYRWRSLFEYAFLPLNLSSLLFLRVTLKNCKCAALVLLKAVIETCIIDS